MITFKHKGDFKHIEKFFNGVLNPTYLKVLERYGDIGVSVLSAATPVASGLTAASWSYDVTHYKTYSKITWYNSNVEKGVPIAIILQYGHGTGTGGYVQGRDYINPGLQPIFDKMADDVWKEVTDL